MPLVASYDMLGVHGWYKKDMYRSVVSYKFVKMSSTPFENT